MKLWSLSLASLLVARVAPAQVPEEVIEREAAEGEVSSSVVASESTGSPPPAPVRDSAAREKDAARAMSRYELGQFQPALSGLRAVLEECAGEEVDCNSSELASLYARLAVVLSSADSNPQVSVVVWRKALAIDPGVEPAPEHRTPRVLAAYDEARHGSPENAAPQSQEGAASVPPATAEPEPKRRVFLLGTGSLKLGVIVSDLFTETMGDAEGAVTFGGLTSSRSGLAFGVRARGGGDFVGSGLGGYWGATALVGNVFGSRQANSFGYLLGGPGAKHFIGAEFTHPAVELIGGKSFHGIIVGGGLHYSYGQVGYQVTVGPSSPSVLPANGHVMQVSIEVGGGQLF